MKRKKKTVNWNSIIFCNKFPLVFLSLVVVMNWKPTGHKMKMKMYKKCTTFYEVSDYDL